jgi:hypothetical protein
MNTLASYLTQSVPPIQSMHVGLNTANGSTYLYHNIRVESNELLVLRQRKAGLTILAGTAYLRRCLSNYGNRQVLLMDYERACHYYYTRSNSVTDVEQ